MLVILTENKITDYIWKNKTLLQARFQVLNITFLQARFQSSEHHLPAGVFPSSYKTWQYLSVNKHVTAGNVLLAAAGILCWIELLFVSLPSFELPVDLLPIHKVTLTLVSSMYTCRTLNCSQGALSMFAVRGLYWYSANICCLAVFCVIVTGRLYGRCSSEKFFAFYRLRYDVILLRWKYITSVMCYHTVLSVVTVSIH